MAIDLAADQFHAAIARAACFTVVGCERRQHADTFRLDERYISATLARPSLPNVYVSIYMARGGNQGVSRVFARAVILLDVIEPTTMETGRVTVNAAAMAKDLADVGRVALYEIYFDTAPLTSALAPLAPQRSRHSRHSVLRDTRRHTPPGGA